MCRACELPVSVVWNTCCSLGNISKNLSFSPHVPCPYEKTILQHKKGAHLMDVTVLSLQNLLYDLTSHMLGIRPIYVAIVARFVGCFWSGIR